MGRVNVIQRNKRVSKRDTAQLVATPTDPSIEFDLFEDMRLKLVEVFVNGGRERIEAEKIALYVVQGVRHVPRLLKALQQHDSITQDEVLDALGLVLDEAPALRRAKRLLLHMDGGEA